MANKKIIDLRNSNLQFLQKDETIKLLNDFISKNKLNISLQEIELLVYEAQDYNMVIQVWLNECEKV